MFISAAGLSTKNSTRIGKYYNFLLLLAFVCTIFCNQCSSEGSGWNQVPEILARIQPPVFPERDFCIMDYGAKGDGQFDCTVAFNAAISDCHNSGGGRVIVPEGKFLTGAIHLKSNVNLHLDEKAVLLFSTDYAKYLPVVFTRFEGVECLNYSPFIYAFELENIAITGDGVLDGQADNDHWWPWAGREIYGWQSALPNQFEDRWKLMQMTEENVPVEERVFGEGHYLRPNFIQFYRCKNVLVEGVTIKRSPMWEIHPVLCENVTVRDVSITSHGPNNDGCNPESSQDVLINHCYFDTGDDCIALKSGRNGDGRRINVPVKNVIIQNCIMKDGHGGVSIGSEISGSCSNIFIERCVMDSPNLERALRIKTNSLRGGTIENIHMRHINIGKVSDAILRIYFHYEEGDVGEHTPVVRNVFLEDVSSQESNYALILDGYERSPISNVNLIDCRFNGVREASILTHVQGLKMKNVYINNELQR